MFEDYPEVLNVDEACELLRIGRNNFYKLLKEDNSENKLRAFKNGRIWKIPKIAVQQYIMEQAQIRKV